MEDLFSHESKKELTRLALHYNRMEDSSERESIREYLLKKIELLIYFIPLRQSYLTEEEITEFYLAQRDHALSMLECYVISKRSFTDYLSQVLRKRARIFMLKKYQDEKMDMVANSAYLWGSDESVYLSDIEESYSVDDGAHSCQSNEFKDYTFEEICSFLISARKETNEYEDLNESEKEIIKILSYKKDRKDFVLLLLYAPLSTLNMRTREIARFLSAPEDAVEKFLEEKHLFCSSKRDKREKIREVAIRHFRSLVRLNFDYTSYKIDDDGQKEVSDHAQRVNKSYQKRIKQMRNMNRGLTQGEISRLIKVTRSSVSQSIKCICEKLKYVDLSYL